MNQQMKRLYEAAQELKGVASQTALAKLLNESPQTIHNWEARGISKRGLLAAQQVIGCSAEWICSGKGPMTISIRSSEQLTKQQEVEDEQSNETVTFDLLDVKASAGPGIFVNEYAQVVRRMSMLESWTRQNIGLGDLSHIKLITASGTSMSGSI